MYVHHFTRSCHSVIHTPKIEMENEHAPIETETHVPNHQFLCLCKSWGVYVLYRFVKLLEAQFNHRLRTDSLVILLMGDSMLIYMCTYST